LCSTVEATVGCEETFSQVCSDLNNLSSEVRGMLSFNNFPMLWLVLHAAVSSSVHA